MAEATVFTPDVARRVLEATRRVERMSRGGSLGAAEPFTKFGPDDVRIGRTTTNDEFPDYPSSGNTFVVEFGWTDFLEIPGDQTLDFTAYSPSITRVARDLEGKYWAEGSLVLCVLRRGKWHIIGASPLKLIRFKMTSKLPLGGQGTAIEIGTGATYTEVGEEFPIKDPWDDPGSFRDDIHDVRRDEGKGYRGWCWIPPDADIDSDTGEPIREIIWMEHIAKWIDFTLLTDMAGSAEVTVDAYHDGRDPKYTWPDDAPDADDRKVYVYDTQGLFPRALEDGKGIAEYNEREHRYEVVFCDQQVSWMRCNLLANMCSGDSAALTAHAAVSWSGFGTMPGTLPTTAQNPFALEAASGKKVLIVFNDASEEWEVVQTEHVHKEFAKTIYYDADSCTVKRTYFSGSYMSCDPSETNATAITLEENTIATGETNTAYDTPSGSDPAYCITTIETFVACTFPRKSTGSATLIAAEAVTLLSNIYDDGTCLMQTPHVTFVICAGYDTTDEDVTCTTDCETGTGG